MAGKKKLAEKTKSENVLSLSTETFKALVSKAYKGVGNNKLLPLTQLLCIKVSDGKLTLVSSDSSGTNYLYVTQTGVDGEFYAVVLADQFAKLIEKLTCDKVTLEVDADKLNITGNGKYTIALQYDEMGNSIQYPDPLSELKKAKESIEVNMDVASRSINSVKPSLATDTKLPCLTGYYAGDIIAATNGDEMSIFNHECLKTPAVIYPIALELLVLSADDKFTVEKYAGQIIVFRASDIVIYSHEMEGLEDYPSDALKDFLESDMPSKCKLSKNALLQALDRISLFVGTYDDNAIKLHFSGKALEISSLASTGVESITYNSGDKDDFECTLDLQSFMKHVKTQSTDEVELQFGDDSAIKLIDNEIVQILSLFEDSENE